MTTTTIDPCPRCGAPCYDLVNGPGPEDDTAKVCMKDESRFYCVTRTCAREDPYSCNSPFIARVLPTPESTKKQLYNSITISCDDRRKLFQRRPDAHSSLRLQWITQLLRAAHQLASATVPEAADLWSVDYMFWIRLYGVLDDIKPFVTRLRTPMFAGDAAPRQRFEGTLQAINTVAALFTDDELLYIQYRRDEACHPVAEAYELSQRMDGRLVEEKTKTLLARPVRHDDYDRAVEGVIERYKPNEFAIACDFARRALPDLEALIAEALKIFA
jgi:hypothetical protein